MSGAAVDQVGMDDSATFDNSRLNTGRIIGLLSGRARFSHIFSRLEADSDVILGRFVRPIVPDKSVKFVDPRSNRYDSESKAVIFSSFLQ